MLVDLAQGRICRRQVHLGPGTTKGHWAGRWRQHGFQKGERV